MKRLNEFFSDIRIFFAPITLFIALYGISKDQIIIPIIITIIFVIIYIIIGNVLKKRNEKKINDINAQREKQIYELGIQKEKEINDLKNQKNHGTFFTFDRSEDANRNKYFQDLRNSANERIMIMGIGLSNVAGNLKPLRIEIESGKKIQLLMIEPDYFSSAIHLPDNYITDCMQLECANLNKQDIDKKISDNSKRSFIDFFKEQGHYIETIKNSKTVLIKFIESLNRDVYPEATIELRTYKSIIPVNMTMIDGMKLIVEFCYPFTDERIMGEFSQKEIETKVFFEKSKLSLINIWEKADCVAKFPK
jgi:hypothetical protein